MKRTFKYYLKHSLFYLGGDQPVTSWGERLSSASGAFLGLFLVLTAARYLGELAGANEWLIASLGASALLVFSLPQSPMAQPWAVIAGNTLSALVGISVAHLVSNLHLAMSLAASLSILGMFLLRCLHPPAAAVALIVVLGRVMHYGYAFFPVMVESVLLILVGFIHSCLIGGRYPNRPS